MNRAVWRPISRVGERDVLREERMRTPMVRDDEHLQILIASYGKAPPELVSPQRVTCGRKPSPEESNRRINVAIRIPSSALRGTCLPEEKDSITGL